MKKALIIVAIAIILLVSAFAGGYLLKGQYDEVLVLEAKEALKCNIVFQKTVNSFEIQIEEFQIERDKLIERGENLTGQINFLTQKVSDLESENQRLLDEGVENGEKFTGQINFLTQKVSDLESEKQRLLERVGAWRGLIVQISEAADKALME